MTKKELRIISIKYRTLASQMLKIDSQEEINCIKMYFDYITNTPILFEYITKCHKYDYDFKEIYQNKNWNDMLELPDEEESLVDYGYQLLQYILDGPKQLFHMGQGYSSSRKFKDIIAAFMRKAVEPFVVAVKNHLEIALIECEESSTTAMVGEKRIFLSYCQKDSDVADIIEEKIVPQIKGRAKISRDIRDVEYHESFKKFMHSIEMHDYVIMVISNNYLKSRNCMFEVLEVIKDSQYQKKLAFIVLENEDISFYKNSPNLDIGANVYTTEGQTAYTLYWASVESGLQSQIEAIGDTTRAIHQIKEKRVVQKILLDLPEFIEFLKDVKGLSLSEHIKNDFADILKFMNLT